MSNEKQPAGAPERWARRAVLLTIALMLGMFVRGLVLLLLEWLK